MEFLRKHLTFVKISFFYSAILTTISLYAMFLEFNNVGGKIFFDFVLFKCVFLLSFLCYGLVLGLFMTFNKLKLRYLLLAYLIAVLLSFNLVALSPLIVSNSIFRAKLANVGIGYLLLMVSALLCRWSKTKEPVVQSKEKDVDYIEKQDEIETESNSDCIDKLLAKVITNNIDSVDELLKELCKSNINYSVEQIENPVDNSTESNEQHSSQATDEMDCSDKPTQESNNSNAECVEELLTKLVGNELDSLGELLEKLAENSKKHTDKQLESLIIDSEEVAEETIESLVEEEVVKLEEQSISKDSNSHDCVVVLTGATESSPKDLFDTKNIIPNPLENEETAIEPIPCCKNTQEDTPSIEVQTVGNRNKKAISKKERMSRKKTPTKAKSNSASKKKSSRKRKNARKKRRKKRR